MKIIIASRIGFCSGVERAVNMAKTVISSGKKVYMLGELIHNKRVISSFRKFGVDIRKDIPKDSPSAYLITRSHGISPKVFEEAKKYNLNIIDTTCPFVRRVQEIAKGLLKNGYELILVGDKGHAEINAVISRIPQNALVSVISNEEDLKDFRPHKNRVGIVSQTTQSLDFFSKVVGDISKYTYELLVYNTICEETVARQNEVDSLSKGVDVVIVIGDRNSANTNRLFQIAMKNCPRTIFIEKPQELKKEYFKTDDVVLLVSGASTPYEFVKEVEIFLKNLKWEE